MIIVRFATLTGKFAVLPEEHKFSTSADALAAVTKYAEANGYRNVKAVMDVDSLRYTAITPGGRGGRNVAFADFTEEC
jgi:hypothetical protein